MNKASTVSRGPMPHKYKTCKRYNDVGHAHALTFSCFHRQPFLSRDRSRRWLVDAVVLARQKHDFDLWAYVIMPEHVHLLIWPRQVEYRVSSILATIKQSVTRRALLFVQRQAPSFLPRMADAQPGGKTHYRFWQRGGGYDRNLTEPGTIWAEIHYIHANPVRRGLCRHPEAWYWSSAATIAGLDPGPLDLNLDSLPRTRDG